MEEENLILLAKLHVSNQSTEKVDNNNNVGGGGGLDDWPKVWDMLFCLQRACTRRSRVIPSAMSVARSVIS